MKKLITVNKVKQKYAEKCSVILVDKDTLVTMAAKDKAVELNIEFKIEKMIDPLKPPSEKEKKEVDFTEDLIQEIVQEVIRKLSKHEEV